MALLKHLRSVHALNHIRHPVHKKEKSFSHLMDLRRWSRRHRCLVSPIRSAHFSFLFSVISPLFAMSLEIKQFTHPRQAPRHSQHRSLYLLFFREVVKYGGGRAKNDNRLFARPLQYHSAVYRTLYFCLEGNRTL